MPAWRSWARETVSTSEPPGVGVVTVWRILRDGPMAGATNMAVDHALAACWQPGTAVLRLYQWDRPTISLGRNQPAREAYDREAARRAGFGFVRRPTGGRAVLHDREVTYAVVADPRTLGGARAAYAAVHRALLAGLGELGIDAGLTTGSSRGARLDDRPCFTEPAPGEIQVSGRKLVGSAQARIGGVLLQHGAILTVNDQSALERLSVGARSEGAGAASWAPVAVTLAGLAAPSDAGAVADAVERGFRRHLGVELVGGELTRAERVERDRLAERYADPDWTWRL